MPDFYKVLQVDPLANAEAIRAAYRVLARRYHPDLGGDASVMTAINEAWATLRDPMLRAVYDAARQPPTRQAADPRSDAPSFESVSSDAAPVEPPPSGPIASRRTTTDPAGSARGASSTVLDFGRYNGWSIAQLAAHDPTFLEWLARTPIGRPMRSEILATLEMHRSAAAAKATAPRPQRRRGRVIG